MVSDHQSHLGVYKRILNIFSHLTRIRAFGVRQACRTHIGRLVLICGLLAFPQSSFAAPEFKDVFNKHSSIMLLIDPKNGNIVDANNAASNFYGYPQELLRTMKIQTINQLTAVQVAEERRLAASEGRNFFIFRHKISDGTIRTVTVHSVPLDFSGRTLLHSIIQDISKERELQEDLWHYQSRLEDIVDQQTDEIEEKSTLAIYILGGSSTLLVFLVIFLLQALRKNKKAQHELRESEKQQRDLLNNTSSVIYIKDTDGKYVFVNHKFESLFHLSNSDIIGKTDQDIFPAETAITFRTNDLKTLGLNAPLEIEELVPQDDGDHTYISVKFPLRHLSGEVYALCGISTDITELKNAEKDLVIAKETAETANNAKSDFLSSMSHELRTPLNAILGFAQVLELSPKDPLNKKQKNATAQIIKGGEHLLSLIDDILNLTKIESGSLKLDIEPLHALQALNDCIEMVKPMARTNNITIHHENFSDAVFLADQIRLKQVLFNLLSNAVKYNQKGGKITISNTDIENNMHRISIVDTGHGIPLNRQIELFQPFSRLGAENSNIEGTGIGLTITQHLVKVMGGDISFQSSEGVGTTFWVDLPLSTHDHKTPKSSSLKDDKKDVFMITNASRILYIEDNTSLVELMKTIMEDLSDVELHTAPTAEQGLAMAQKDKPQLILMDINLPGMSGIEALAVLKCDTATADIPVIAISADAMPAEVQKGVEAGFLTYLTKPFNIPELISVVSDTLSASKPEA